MTIKLVTELDKEISSLSTVTDYEKAIMILYNQGYTYKEIGVKLNTSVDAIYYILKNLSRNDEVYDLLH